jgi:hypothetical protein
MMPNRLTRLLGVALALAAFAIAVSGCGSSEKPEYCSDVSDLEGSVEELHSVNLESGALPTVQADLKKIQTNTNAVVASAKQDFPAETSALKSSVSTLSTAINQLPSAPTPAELLALGSAVEGAVTAANELSSATESACD